MTACASIFGCEGRAEVQATYQRLSEDCSPACWPDSKPFCRPCGERLEREWQPPHNDGCCAESHPVEFLRMEEL